MLKKILVAACVLFASSALSSGCDCGYTAISGPDKPGEHITKLFVIFDGNRTLGTPADPLEDEVVDVTVDGVVEGTATQYQQFYEIIDTGKHVITTKSHLVNSTYTTTHYFPAGEQFTFYFNCGDAHVTFSADAAWALAGVSKLDIFYGKSGTTLTLVPGEQAKAAVEVQAGGLITIYDQNKKLLKSMKVDVPYDATTPFAISYP